MSAVEFLQGRLLLETTRPEFSEMPFRFAEIAKVLLDVCVSIVNPFKKLMHGTIERQMTSKNRTRYAHYSKTFEKHVRPKAEKVFRN